MSDFNNNFNNSFNTNNNYNDNNFANDNEFGDNFSVNTPYNFQPQGYNQFNNNYKKRSKMSAGKIVLIVISCVIIMSVITVGVAVSSFKASKIDPYEHKAVDPNSVNYSEDIKNYLNTKYWEKQNTFTIKELNTDESTSTNVYDKYTYKCVDSNNKEFKTEIWIEHDEKNNNFTKIEDNYQAIIFDEQESNYITTELKNNIGPEYLCKVNSTSQVTGIKEKYKTPEEYYNRVLPSYTVITGQTKNNYDTVNILIMKLRPITSEYRTIYIDLYYGDTTLIDYTAQNASNINTSSNKLIRLGEWTNNKNGVERNTIDTSKIQKNKEKQSEEDKQNKIYT